MSAFSELYKLTSGRAYYVAFEITKNEQDAEDILQESYVKMLEKIGTLDKPESFVSWFHHMVANKSKDSLKKRKPTLFEGGEDEAFEVIPDENTSFSPEGNLDQDELRRAVIEVIDELTEEKRACVMLMYFEEMSVNEISESLEIPVSTVKNRLFTARKDMKAKFEKRGITSLYSTAPIGLVIWAFSKTAEAVSESFAQSAASARVLSGISVSGTATAATAAGAGSASAATAATAAGSGTAAASAGAGAAAKIAALTVTQKAVAGIVAVGVIGGSAATVAIVSDNNREDGLTTTAVIEEVTTAPIFETEIAVSVIATAESTTEGTQTLIFSVTQETETRKETESYSVTSAKTTAATEKDTTKKEKTTKEKTTRAPRTTKATTVKETTTVPETTKKVTTTREETTEEETTKKAATTARVTTTKPTTTQATTAKPTTTAAPTTTAPQKATVTVSVLDENMEIVDTLTFDVDAGTELSHDTLFELVEPSHTITAGFGGADYQSIAEAGGSYSIEAYK
ncbi:MAG: RNA polymerase sigma factor [Clostridia bacterium]|nr:RNA polymerase sigma factor [Clostridia bacterium]